MKLCESIVLMIWATCFSGDISASFYYGSSCISVDGSSRFCNKVGANAESNVSSDENKLLLIPFYSLTLSSANFFGLRVRLARSLGDSAEISKGEAIFLPSRPNLAKRR